MGRRNLAVLSSSIVALVLVAAAPAANAAEIATRNALNGWSTLEYRALPGEKNNPNIRLLSPDLVLITDTATLHSTGTQACTGLLLLGLCSPITALLQPAPSTIGNALLGLGDGDDSFVSPAFPGYAFVFDGPGNDRVDIAAAAAGSVGAGQSLIYAPATNTDHDVYIGNAKQSIAYPFTSPVGVTISLDDIANDGTAGENDNVIGFGEVDLTGRADTFTGNDRGNTVDGLAGADHITTGAGADHIETGYNASGAVISAGAGDDQISVPWADGVTVDCGPGNDTVTLLYGGTGTISPNCENVVG